MKKFLVLAAVLLLASATGIFAETPVKTYRELDRATAEKAFEQLTKNAQKGLLAPNAVVQSKFVAIEEIHLEISGGTGTGSDGNTDSQPADEPVDIPITNGMRVWFELTDGKLVNPSVYRFSPGEKFSVHIEAAVPVFVLLYQHFPREEGRDPVLRYPDPQFEKSYDILNPAVRTKLFTGFRTDDSDKAEHMSIVVARADWDGIVKNVPNAAAAAAAWAQANAQGQRNAVLPNMAKGIADISSPAVLAKFADISKQANWDFVVDEKRHFAVTPGGVVKEIVADQAPDNIPTPQPEIPAPNLRQSPYRQVIYRNERTPPPQWDGTSDKVNDVANYLFTDIGIGQLQIVLEKVEYLAP